MPNKIKAPSAGKLIFLDDGDAELIKFTGLEISSFNAMLVACALWTSANAAKIVRGGFLSLPEGQTEAGNMILTGSVDPVCDPKEWVDPDDFNREVNENQWFQRCRLIYLLGNSHAEP
jgi:hypothetical protein